MIFKIYYWWLLQVRTSLTGLTGPPTHPRAVFTIRTTVEKDLQWAVPRHGCQQKGFSFTSSSAGTSTSEKSRPKRQISSADSPPYTTYTHTFMEIAKLKHFRCLTISRKISQTINGKVHTGQSVNNFITLTNLLPKPIDNFSSSSPSYRRKKINWKERYTRVL